MKLKNLFSLLLPIVALVFAGCGRKSAELAKSDEPVVFGPQHSAKKGLFVPADTRQSLGLKIVEVTEQKVPAMFEVQMRVYDVGGPVSRASGTVTPDQAKGLKVGQVLQVRSRNGKSTPAKVMGLNNQLLKATGMMELLVEISQMPGDLTLGTFVRASIALDSNESVVTIPRAALLQCSDGYSVYTVSGEHLVRAPVKVGASTTDLVEIKDGLYAGDQVVLQPVMSLWMTELAAVKGGQACCVEPAKGK